MRHEDTPDIQPPRWADKLLEWRCPDYLFEEVQGDLYELFEERVAEMGLKRARRQYVLDVLGFLRPFAFRRNKNNANIPLNFPDMLRNHLSFAWRNLWRNKGYAFLNMAGLAVGLAGSFLIMLWVWDELTYDSFHQNYARLYQIGHNRENDGTISTGTGTPYPLSGSLKDNFPEIKYACRMNASDAKLLTVGEKKIYRTVNFVDSVFLEMFSFQLLQGFHQTALDDPKSVVLTETTAKILFGGDNPIGKTVRFDNVVDLKVTGVVANVPDNSTFQFDFILPYRLHPILDEWYKTLDNNWGNNVVKTFVQLQDNASEVRLNAKIQHFLLTKNKDATNETLFLNPMAKWRLYDKFENGKSVGGLIEYVRMFSWIAGFILLIACINFMNLATARSEKRAKEVGIRKVVGSTRRSLVFQFLGESNLLALLALGLAIMLVALLLPLFNQLTDKQLILPLTNPVYWLAGLGVAVLSGMLAGLYPAFYLSSFQPVRVLKSTLQIGKNASLPRKILVNLQFIFSILLIISVIIINQQLQYSKNRTTGYDRNNLMTTDFNDEMKKNYEVLRQDLLNSGLVSSVCRTQAPITQIRMYNSVEWKPQQGGGVVTVCTDYDYLPTFGVKIKQGRGFSRNFLTDSSAVLINETALKMMNFKQPIGEEIVFWGKSYHVIGVIEDVIMGSPYQTTEPMGAFFKPSSSSKLNIRFKNGADIQEALAKTGQLFEKHSPSYPFDYQFVDDEYNKKFISEVRVGNLAKAFAGLAIFISCLGLFGLAAYTAERRTKEIGIRKVLGANLTQLVTLLSKAYVKLVAVSLLIASPLAWYFLEKWLQNYPYRIEIGWSVFALAGLAALFIALLTVSYQAIKAALANPVKSLRTE